MQNGQVLYKYRGLEPWEFLLDIFINKALIPYCEKGPILKLRKHIQDDPLVVRELALRLTDLKKMFKRYRVNGVFKFK